MDTFWTPELEEIDGIDSGRPLLLPAVGLVIWSIIKKGPCPMCVAPN